ncbi:hypothetical protein, partial [Schleiferia thermophila]
MSNGMGTYFLHGGLASKLLMRFVWSKGFWLSGFRMVMRQGGGGYEPQQAGCVAHGRGGGAGASHRSP